MATGWGLRGHPWKGLDLTPPPPTGMRKSARDFQTKEQELGERVVSRVSHQQMFENYRESTIPYAQGMVLLERNLLFN